jgi:TonB family protein
MRSVRNIFASVLSVAMIATASCARRQPAETVLVAHPAPDTLTIENGRYVFQVEKPAVPSPLNQPPQFPPALRGVKTHGEVIVKFVVDTSGVPDMKTVEIRKSDDPQFTDAVRRVLPKYHFYPAEIAGRKVRQLVQMPFYFTI